MKTLCCLLFLVLASLSPATAAEPPTPLQGAYVLAAKVKAESQGLLVVVGFQKINGQKSVVNGVEMYTMDCYAEVFAKEDCAMTGFVMGNWNGSFGAILPQRNATELDKVNPFGAAFAGNRQVAKGATMKFTLSLHFDLTEAGWRSGGRLVADVPAVPTNVIDKTPYTQ
jgi:hypothetical protein